MDSHKTTLIDDIFLSDFRLYKSGNWKLSFVSSELIDRNKINSIKPHIAYPLSIFKDHSFYFMVEPTVYVNYKENLLEIAQSLCKSIGQFIEDTTLKKVYPKATEGKPVEIVKLLSADDDTAYHIESQFSDNNKCFSFSIFIPRKTINHLIALLLRTNIAKIDDPKKLSDYISELRTEFYRKNINFPLDIVDFFNAISNNDFQKIVGSLLSNNLMSYDMLWALASKIDDGIDRVLNNISKNQKDDFLEAVSKNAESADFKWVEIAIYQIGLSLDALARDKKIESLQMERLKKILEDIVYRELELFFYVKSFDSWIEKAFEEKTLQDVLSQCNDLILAKGFISIQEKTVSLIEKNISKRKLQYLKEDIDYQKRNCTKSDEILAQYEIVKMLISFSFKHLSSEEKLIEKWIPRFRTINDLNFAVNYLGPIEFSLSLIPLSIPMKRYVIKNLKSPLKYFVSYFLTNKIKLNFPYGDLRIKEATNNVIKAFYQLEKEGKIILKPFEELVIS
ncbi:MAG: hypothetical protein OEV44_07970 [Spirochaetota bacterium]|nr:hypothetical protein [Spirochaetota bacterium]